jgi:hypothetical protein
MVAVVKPGSQRDRIARALGRLEYFGLREHPAEGRERPLIRNIDEKVAVAFGGEVSWL